jgi:DNA-binding response OmpR family regulator
MTKRIMIVEDDVLIGIDLVEQLLEVGFDAVGPYVNAGDALTEFEKNGCDAAVVDVNLGKSTSLSFAEELRSKSIPFLVLSGYSHSQRPAGFSGMPSANKPVNLPELVRTLNGMLD